MPLYLDKVLAQLVYPLNLAIAVMALGGILLVLRRRFWGTFSFGLGLFWLVLWSLPVVADTVQGWLERNPGRVAFDALPRADLIVVLGGGIRAGTLQQREPDLRYAADRYWHAARLYHAGKAPMVLISGGRVAWQGQGPSEAEIGLNFLADLGVPRDATVLETESRNTRENAVYTGEIIEALDVSNVLLVTSAAHMRRALGTFRGAGIEVVAAPTDFEVFEEPTHLLRWIPDAEALHRSTKALKEFLGYYVYCWRGWIDTAD